MADAIGEDDAGDVVAARENCGKVAAGIGSGWDGDDVGFKAGEFERAVGAFVAGPEFHASEGADDGGCALDGFGFDFFEFHLV
jgi:hypothetical protein